MKVLVDQRAARSRRQLLESFRHLVLQRGFESVSVAEIAAHAGVGRSTLYQHFAGKNGLLAASIKSLFSTLAQLIDVDADVQGLQPLLEHFWGNRTLARALFSGSARRVCIQALVHLVEERLRARGLARRGALALPLRLAAVQIAEMMLAPIIAWLLGESRCTPQVLAESLPRMVNAALGALTHCR